MFKLFMKGNKKMPKSNHGFFNIPSLLLSLFQNKNSLKKFSWNLLSQLSSLLSLLMLIMNIKHTPLSKTIVKNKRKRLYVDRLPNKIKFMKALTAFSDKMTSTNQWLQLLKVNSRSHLFVHRSTKS